MSDSDETDPRAELVEIVRRLPPDLREGWERLEAAGARYREQPEHEVGRELVRAAAALCDSLIQVAGRLPLALFVASGAQACTIAGRHTLLRRCFREARDRATGTLHPDVLREQGVLTAGWWLGTGRAAAEVLSSFLEGPLIDELHAFHRDHAADLDALLEYRNGAAHGVKHPASVPELVRRLESCLAGLGFLMRYRFEVQEPEPLVVGPDTRRSLARLWVTIDDGDVRFSGSGSFGPGFWEQSFGALVERYRQDRRGEFDFSPRIDVLRGEAFEPPPALEGALLDDGLLLVTGFRLTGKSMAVAHAERLPLARGRQILHFLCEQDGPTCSGLSFLLWLRRRLHIALAGPAEPASTMDFEEALADVRERLLPEAERQQVSFVIAVDDVDRAVRCPYSGEPALPDAIARVRAADGARAAVAFLLTGAPGTWRDLKLPRATIVLEPEDNPRFEALSREGAGHALWKELGADRNDLRRELLRVLHAAADTPLTARQIAAAIEEPSFLVRHELGGLRTVLHVEEARENTFRLYSEILDPHLGEIPPEPMWETRIAQLNEQLAARA